MTIYKNIPYTYRIRWSKINMNYYGVRYSKYCNPSDLFVTYFTSSSYVANYIKEHGLPDIIEIRKTFTSTNRVNESRNWEHKVLKRLNVSHRNDYLNKSNGKSIPPMFGDDNPIKNSLNKKKFLEAVRSPAHRLKQSESVKQRVINGTHHFLGETVNKKRVSDGIHHFLGGTIQGETSRRRVNEGTHNFIGDQHSRRQLENGTHPSQRKWVCENCNKIGNGLFNYNRWHGVNCRLLLLSHSDKK